MHALTDFWGQ